MAGTTTYMTVRLERGKHGSPDQGACVMELASMIAGERFTDRPRSACRVIGAVLRAYNDAIDDERRQDLYRLAAEVVGTRASKDVESRRIERCMEVFDDLRDEGRRSMAWRRRSPSPRIVRAFAYTGELDAFARELARVLVASGAEGHDRALGLADELIAMSDTVVQTAPEPELPARPTVGSGTS
jgi:hypothetical protein